MSILVSVRKVANNSLQGELLDTVVKGEVNVLALLNKGDNRFKNGSERRAWFPVTLQSLGELGVNKATRDQIAALEQGQSIELNIENPKIEGYELRIQVEETVVPNTYQRANTMKVAKQIMITEKVAKSKIATEFDLSKAVNMNGYFLDAEGQYIFTNTVVKAEGQVSHKFIQGVLVPENELANYGATLAQGVVVTQVSQEQKV